MNTHIPLTGIGLIVLIAGPVARSLEEWACVMGFLHDGTLLPMPLYFFVLGKIMLLIGVRLLRQKD